MTLNYHCLKRDNSTRLVFDIKYLIKLVYINYVIIIKQEIINISQVYKFILVMLFIKFCFNLKIINKKFLFIVFTNNFKNK
jgi:hypothetical protein